MAASCYFIDSGFQEFTINNHDPAINAAKILYFFFGDFMRTDDSNSVVWCFMYASVAKTSRIIIVRGDECERCICLQVLLKKILYYLRGDQRDIGFHEKNIFMIPDWPSQFSSMAGAKLFLLFDELYIIAITGNCLGDKFFLISNYHCRRNV